MSEYLMNLDNANIYPFYNDISLETQWIIFDIANNNHTINTGPDNDDTSNFNIVSNYYIYIDSRS